MNLTAKQRYKLVAHIASFVDYEQLGLQVGDLPGYIQIKMKQYGCHSHRAGIEVVQADEFLTERDDIMKFMSECGPYTMGILGQMGTFQIKTRYSHMVADAFDLIRAFNIMETSR